MRSRFRIDLWLFFPVIVLITLSLTTLLSINPVFFKNQLVSLIVAIVAFLFVSQMDVDFFRTLKKPIYFSSLALFLVVLLLGIESRGAMRWVEVMGVRIQFSEIMKPFLSLSFAAFLAEDKYLTKGTFFKALLLLIPVLVMIDLQPDLGNALIYGFSALFTFIIIGFPLIWFFVASLPILLASPLIWARMHDYQKQRVLTFLNPSSDPLGASYNGIQAIIAVGSGSLWGKGLSEGTQSGLRFLPERQTDFIFATIGEGLGLIGILVILAAFFLICYRIYKIFQRSDDAYRKIFVAASFAFFFIQFTVNMGMNIGYLPIVGVTLPFVSFGGSSMLSNFIFLGLLSSISISQSGKEVLEIR